MSFIDKQKEYIIEDMYPKRPLMNFLWNDEYIAVVNQFGFGKGRFSAENNFQHELVRDTDSRIIYIKDGKELFSPNRNYDRKKFDVFKTVVGMGYSKIISEYNGIHTELTIIVPTTGKRECWRLEVSNVSNNDKNIDIYAYNDIDIQFSEHLSCTYGDFNLDLNGIYFRHRVYNSPTDYCYGYFATNENVLSYDTAKRRFVGVYGDLRHPDGTQKEKLDCCDNSFDAGTMAALHFKVELARNEQKEIYFTVGAEKTLADSVNSAGDILSKNAFDNELKLISERSSMYDDKIYIQTPDDEINRFVNIWLKRQMDLGKTWGRVYNKGFRDIMQDISGFVQLDSTISKEKIIDCTQYQLVSGNTLRSWVPLDKRPYRDGAVWLLQTVCAYIKETADYGILNTMIPYYDGDTEETLFEHCIRGIDFLYDNTGEHGLCLWGGGDWNDSFDGAGLLLKGESVWLSIATVKATNDFAELLNRLRKTDLSDKYLKKRNVITKNIKKFGWDKDHFIYGINDWGEKVGSYDTKEGQMFLNPQTWAVLADIADSNDELMDFVENDLKCDFGYVQQKPCYKTPEPHLGRISYFGNGFYENGSVYNHGVAFKIVADCLAGRGDSAYETIKMMMPSNPKNDYKKSGVEPYALCNMYFGPENTTRSGEAPMYWITGTSSWTFRGIVEYLIGVRAEYDGLLIEPNIPSSWKGVSATRKFRDAIYNICIERTGERTVMVDGKMIDTNIVPSFNDGATHTVTVTV